MAGSSKLRRISTPPRSSISGGIGVLPIPDPRAWPEDIRTWFRRATGECGALDIFIFDYGQMAALYLQDAVTAAAVLEIDASEWHTQRGFPAFCFDSARIPEIQQRLASLGYAVHVLVPADRQPEPKKRKRAEVLSIAAARERVQRTQT